MRRFLALPATLAAAALLTAGCGAGGPVPANADKARGKQLFQQKCGACHTLADAAKDAASTTVAIAAYKRFIKLAPDDNQVPYAKQQIKALQSQLPGASQG